ncbi:MAG TPA: M56 family metallopeptidase [Desulfosporosinus sp.]|nr:M56 family metallopeptidase [Desulfosporosinus sp.]
MNITVYSVLMAIIWCNVFTTVVALIRRRNSFIIHFSILPLIFLVFVSVFRLLFSIEFPITTVVRSEVILPVIIVFFTEPLFVIERINAAVSIANILVAIWAGGCFYYIQKYLVQLIRLNKNLAAIPCTTDEQILSVLNKIMAESGKYYPVKIIKSTAVISPMVVGFFKPTIILPDILFSDSELKNILLHELTHFLHKDAWTKLTMYMIMSMFWWNPFIHLLNSDMDHILEIKCDLSLSSKWDEEKRLQYLESITKIARRARSQKSLFNTPPHAAALISTKGSSRTEQRIHLVLGTEPKKRGYNLQSLLICGLALLALISSYTFVFQPARFPAAESIYEDFFLVTPENAYLVINEDNTYSLYADGQFKLVLDQINCEPYLSLPIK